MSAQISPVASPGANGEDARKTLGGGRSRPRCPMVISGATGVKGRTEEERAALDRLAPGARVLAVQDAFGHLMEAQAPVGVALAAAAIARGDAPEAVVNQRRPPAWRGRDPPVAGGCTGACRSGGVEHVRLS